MTATPDNLTPAMKQYLHFKKKYPDAVLFFRMGDFYETFYEDAHVCARVLGLALTSRNKNSDNPVPLAGLPYHAVDSYLKKMIQAGYKVAVCEQIEDPKLAKGVVARDVVRIITPGTLTDDNLLEARQENYLAAAHWTARAAALAWVDISTGQFFVQHVPVQHAVSELSRLAPKEVLIAETGNHLFSAEQKKQAAAIRQLTGATITERPGWYFDAPLARERLLKHFGTRTLAGFGLDADSVLICPAGAIIEYLRETQKIVLEHIRSIRLIAPQDALHIDAASLRALEILQPARPDSAPYTLLGLMDQTLTPMGSRLLRQWLIRPLRRVEPIVERQDAVEEMLVDDRLTGQTRGILKQIADIERIAARISAARALPKDLVGLAGALRQIPALKQLLSERQSALWRRLADACETMDELADLLEAAIEPSAPAHLRDGGVIRDGFSEELDRLRKFSQDGQSWLADFQAREIQRTGLEKLRVGYNKVFGYYIELPHSAAAAAPADYIRKQTVKNAERYITEELKRYEQEALTASQRAIELEQELFEQVRATAAGYVSRLQTLAAAVAECDVLASLAYVARQNRYVRPEMREDKVLEILEGKHPVLAQTLGAEFVPNDVILGADGKDIAIITGPNMAGKSTYIRQTALLVIMAQVGSFIPAKQATIGIVDKIFTRIGASDELAKGQSTFMVEMTETANILNNATDRSLVILDEVGRGTSTYDGLSLAWAITEYLANTIRCRTLFATHYHELTELGQLLANVKNLNVAAREWAGQVIFLHKIVDGGTDKSYGIHVAQLAGLPKWVTERANTILAELESGFIRQAESGKLASQKTVSDADWLFVQRHKSVLERLKDIDVNRLTPLEAIALLAEIQKEMRS